MADIDNLKGGTKRTVDEESLDNLRGGTQRVIQVNSLNNLRGSTQRVYVVGGGGGGAVIDPLNVTPSTSAQTITASGGVDGYSPVNVSAVDSSIDANITAANIKKDVSILGVTGTYEGATPTGTMYIISNGTYNVADKAIANVNVPTSVPALYRAYQLDPDGVLQQNTSISSTMDFTGLKSVPSYMLQNTYSGCTNITGAIDMSDVESIGAYGCTSMFSGCTGITSADLSSLQYVETRACEAMFSSCSALVSVNLSSFVGASGSGAARCCQYMFSDCTSLTSVDLSSLSYIAVQEAFIFAFSGCTALTSLSFPALTTSSFGSRTNQFNNMLSGTTGCTVHFPSNLQSVIGSWASVIDGFGGSHTTVLFDLPATE